MVLETHDVFQRQLYVFCIGVFDDLNAYSWIHSTGDCLCADGPSQKAVWKSTVVW